MRGDAIEARLERLARDIRRYSPRDETAVERFRRETHGLPCRQLDRERFRWLFERNPHRDAEGPAIWLCFKDGEVVGEQAGIPFRLRIGDSECRASWAVDLMVRPEWRIRGVGPALVSSHVRSHDVAVAIGATDDIYPAYLKMGWHDLGCISSHLRPLDPAKLVRQRLAGGRLLTAAARLAGLGPEALALGVRGFNRLKRCRLEPVSRFDERVDEIWRASASGYAVLARRDYRALRWRFDEAPDAERYHRFYLEQRGVAQGYAVLRLGADQGVPLGFLVDHLCVPGMAGQLLAACIEWFRGAGVAAAVCEMLDAKAARWLPALGFIPRKRPTRVLWRPGPTAPANAALLDRRENWLITRADSDWDHPQPGAGDP